MNRIQQNSQIRVQSTNPGKPFLLASDIDGTLLGDPEGEQWIKTLVETLSEEIYFAVITGRSLISIANLVQEGRLPQPDFMVGAVGTKLVDFSDPDNALGKKFLEQVSVDWDLEELYRQGEGPGIRRQDFEEGQPPHQAGFFWGGQTDTLAAFHQRMPDLDQYHIQASAGIYIDVLPHPLGKGYAALFLQKELNLTPERVVVAGDSGNDQEMFTTGLKGIVPVNALDELKTLACEPWHYHSPYPAGRGVIDGLRHFDFIK
jgi:hydroxymethylpyrimidine pyrophosphatase-like HAD family hydrolase